MLTKEQMRAALNWFKSKNGDRGCPVCGTSSWKVEREAWLGGVGTRDTRTVLIICLECGHFLLFSTAIVFCEPDAPTEPAEEDE